MQIVLLWRSLRDGGQSLPPATVALNLQRLFRPLFGTACPQRILRNDGMAMVVLEMPVPGWKPPFFQEDEQTLVQAVDYPINGRKVLEAKGIKYKNDNVLPTLCRELKEQPHALLKDLAPPFSVIWSSKQTGETLLQNDGLGQSQLYEFQDENVWAVSNKIVAFKALGVSLELIPEQWAVWATLDWFPLDMTGYKRIRFLEPGTQLRLNGNGITRSKHDVLSDWVHPEPRSPADCLELARTSLIDLIDGCVPQWEKPSAGLTGGWDSRAVVSSLRAAGARFRARVRGLPGHHDVMIAAELAKAAGLKLRVQHEGGVPPNDPQACRRSMALALLWQGGQMTAYRHKSFLANKEYLQPRKVSITGQHGEIGRRERVLSHDYLSKQIAADASLAGKHEEHVLAELMQDSPQFTKPTVRDFVQDVIRTAYHQADKYALEGPARVDFFSLYEFTRRKGSTVHAWQTRLLIAPFLNPNFIRAVFGYPERPDTNVFHRYIVARNSPDWINVPYFEELEERKRALEEAKLGAEMPGCREMPPHWQQPTGRHNYNDSLYWQVVGKPLIDEALAQGGLWTEIFDPHLAAQQWPTAPDKLAVLYLLGEQ